MWFEEQSKMESPISEPTDAGQVKKLKFKKMSVRSQDLFNDIVEFEETFTSMKVKISGRIERPKETDKRESERYVSVVTLSISLPT